MGFDEAAKRSADRGEFPRRRDKSAAIYAVCAILPRGTFDKGYPTPGYPGARGVKATGVSGEPAHRSGPRSGKNPPTTVSFPRAPALRE